MRTRVQSFGRTVAAKVRKHRSTLVLVSIAIILWPIMAYPSESAHVLSDALGGVGDAAGRLAEFVRVLVGGR